MNLTENILKMNYLNKKYDAFHENLMPVVNQNVPLKEMSNKENKKGSLRQFTNETPISKNLGKQITSSSLSDTNAIEIR